MENPLKKLLSYEEKVNALKCKKEDLLINF